MNTALLGLLTLEIMRTFSLPQHLVSLEAQLAQENSTFILLYGNTLAKKLSTDKPGLTHRISIYLYDVFTKSMMENTGEHSNCHFADPFHMSPILRSALFLTADRVVPLRLQIYWINKSGQRVHQNRLVSNGVLIQFAFDLTCSLESFRVNISLVERSSSFYVYSLSRLPLGVSQSSAHSLSILTLNVWNTNSGARSQPAYSRRLGRLLSELQRIGPDLIGLQEVRFDSRVRGGLSPNQAEHFWGRLHKYDFVFQPANFDMSVGLSDKLEEGLAILSRYPITAWSYILLPSNSSLDVHQRICMHAHIATPVIPQLHVFLTHLSLNRELRRLAVADILKFMSKFEGSKVLMGDMNSEPQSEEMASVRESGMKDAWLAFHSEPDFRTSEKVEGEVDRFFGLTFDATEMFLRKRIDYIYFDQSLLPNADSIELFGTGMSPHRALSDHLGVLLKLVDRGEMPSRELKEEL